MSSVDSITHEGGIRRATHDSSISKNVHDRTVNDVDRQESINRGKEMELNRKTLEEQSYKSKGSKIDVSG